MSARPTTVTERTPDVLTDTDTGTRYVLTRVHVKRPNSIDPIAVLAGLGALFAAGLGAWAVVIGVGWLVWAYTLVTLTVIASGAVVALCVWLALRGNWRARVLSAAMFGALVALVVWTATL